MVNLSRSIATLIVISPAVRKKRRASNGEAIDPSSAFVGASVLAEQEREAKEWQELKHYGYQDFVKKC